MLLQPVSMNHAHLVLNPAVPLARVARILSCAVGEEIKIDELENREYPPGIKAAQVFVTGGTLLIFFAVLYWSVQAWAVFLALFGSYKVSVLTPDASLQFLLTAL